MRRLPSRPGKLSEIPKGDFTIEYDGGRYAMFVKHNGLILKAPLLQTSEQYSTGKEILDLPVVLDNVPLNKQALLFNSSLGAWLNMSITVNDSDWSGTALSDTNIASSSTWNNKVDKTGTIAENDFAKFDSNGKLVGRSYSETRSDLGISDDEIIDWTSDQGSTNIHVDNIPTLNQSTTGNAATATLAADATTLATARDIGGVSFDGSASINLPGVNTGGNQDTSGNATTATTATNVTIATESSDTSCFPLFVTNSSGNLPPKVNTGFSLNSSSGLISTYGGIDLGANSDLTVKIGDDPGTGGDVVGGHLTIRAGDANSSSAQRAGGNLILQSGDGAGSEGGGADGTIIVEDILDITDATDSSNDSGDTGALRCEGGASIAKKLYVGDTITGNLTGNVTGNATGTSATVTSGTQASITTCANLTTTGALASGSIASGFGTIDNGSSAITTTGTLTGGNGVCGGPSIWTFATGGYFRSADATNYYMASYKGDETWLNTLTSSIGGGYSYADVPAVEWIAHANGKVTNIRMVVRAVAVADEMKITVFKGTLSDDQSAITLTALGNATNAMGATNKYYYTTQNLSVSNTFSAGDGLFVGIAKTEDTGTSTYNFSVTVTGEFT